MNLASAPAPFPTHADPSGAIRWDEHMADDFGSTYGPDPLAFLSVPRMKSCSAAIAALSGFPGPRCGVSAAAAFIRGSFVACGCTAPSPATRRSSNSSPWARRHTKCSNGSGR